MIVEYNGYFLPNVDSIVEYDANRTWDGSNYYGASLLAYKRFLNLHNYSLVYCNADGINAFFVNRKILEQLRDKFTHIDDIEFLYRKASYGSYGFLADKHRGSQYELKKRKKDEHHRKFVASSDVMQAVTTAAPVAPTTQAPEAFTTAAPMVPTTQAPEAVTTAAPVAPTTQAPLAGPAQPPPMPASPAPAL